MYYQQSQSVTTTLLNVAKLFARKKSFANYDFIYVKDGVANVTDKRSIFLRFEVQAPDGQYLVGRGGVLEACTKPIQGPFGKKFLTPIEPELIRPPLESMKPFCTFHPVVLAEFLNVLNEAISREEKVYVESKGIGLKRHGEIYFDFAFNLPYKLEFDPELLKVAFTDAMGYSNIEMYQEIRQEHGEMPLTPLITSSAGSGWKNCSLLSPIIDKYRSYYS